MKWSPGFQSSIPGLPYTNEVPTSRNRGLESSDPPPPASGGRHPEPRRGAARPPGARFGKARRPLSAVLRSTLATSRERHPEARRGGAARAPSAARSRQPISPAEGAGPRADAGSSETLRDPPLHWAAAAALIGRAHV